MPAGHDAAALKAAERGAETEREIGLLKSQLGELKGGWDAKVREAADAVKNRTVHFPFLETTSNEPASGFLKVGEVSVEAACQRSF